MRIFLVNYAYELDLEESEMSWDTMLETGTPFATFELAEQSIRRHYSEECRPTSELVEIENPHEVRRGIERLFEGQDYTSGTVRYVILEKKVAEEVTTAPFTYFGYGLE